MPGSSRNASLPKRITPVSNALPSAAGSGFAGPRVESSNTSPLLDAAETAAPTASFEAAARDVASRYCDRGARVYVRVKLWMDPIAKTLHDEHADGGFGRVLDVGCGRAQLPLLLHAAGLADGVVGLDWDEDKIHVAARAAGHLRDVRFEHANVCTAALPEADTVLLIDVLHYLTHEEQDDVLARAARAAKRRVFVRDLDPDAGTSSVVTQSWEWVTTTLGWNRGARVRPRPFRDIARPLEAAGFQVSLAACSTRGLSNTLLVARR